MPKKKTIAKAKKQAGSSPAKAGRKPVRQPARNKPKKPARVPAKAARKLPAKPGKPTGRRAGQPKAVLTPRRPVSARGNRGVRGTTAAEILNSAKPLAAMPSATRVPGKWARHYRNLLRLRDELLIQSGQLARDAHEESVRHSMHMADSGTDSFDRDFALSLLSADQEAIREIEEAMKRIENGTYGLCELTGKPIAQARLDAIPWTRFSYEAQSRLEREGSVNHTHLGSLGSVYASEPLESGEPEEEEEEQPTTEKP